MIDDQEQAAIVAAELAAYRREARIIGIIAGVLRARQKAPSTEAFCTEAFCTMSAYKIVIELERGGFCIGVRN